ncbi:MAG: hypothetical protein MZU91_04820 [Desulfosudis oleivorans]|nr:hypothetical protein [Desulfosudis oleivorans]
MDEINDTVYDMTLNLTHSSDSVVLSNPESARPASGGDDGRPGAGPEAAIPGCSIFSTLFPAGGITHFPSLRHISQGGLSGRLGCEGGADPRRAGGCRRRGQRTCWARRGSVEDDVVVGLQLGTQAHGGQAMARPASFAEVADRLADALGARVVLTGFEGRGASR